MTDDPKDGLPCLWDADGGPKSGDSCDRPGQVRYSKQSSLQGMVRPWKIALQPEIPFFRGLSIRVYNRAVASGTPPHVAVLECHPNVFTWTIQQATKRVKILRRPSPLAKVVFNNLFELSIIWFAYQLMRNALPPKMNLLAFKCRAPPLTARSILHVSYGFWHLGHYDPLVLHLTIRSFGPWIITRALRIIGASVIAFYPRSAPRCAKRRTVALWSCFSDSSTPEGVTAALLATSGYQSNALFSA